MVMVMVMVTVIVTNGHSHGNVYGHDHGHGICDNRIIYFTSKWRIIWTTKSDQVS